MAIFSVQTALTAISPAARKYVLLVEWFVALSREISLKEQWISSKRSTFIVLVLRELVVLLLLTASRQVYKG